MVVDAYHQSKSFTCRFGKQVRKDLSCTARAEISFREPVWLPEDSKAEEAVCGRCRPVSWTCTPEKGRIGLSIKLEAVCLWKGAERYRVTRTSHQIQQMIEAEGMEPSMEASLEFLEKECRLTLISDRQLELSGTLVVTCDGMKEKELLLLDAPGFVEGDWEKRSAMVITAVEEDEDLWDLAKRHRTTEDKIRKVNRLEGDLAAGQKIFIIR